MKLWKLIAAAFCVSCVASANAAIKPCQELKTEIAHKLEAKGVTAYTLSIVDKGKESDGKIVGSCDGGTKSIVYQRATPARQAKRENGK